MALVQHPAQPTNTLVDHWSKYMASPGYQAEKERSGKVDHGNDTAVAVKEAQANIKEKVYELRHKKKQVEALRRKSPATWTSAQRLYVDYYDSGKLKNDLDQLTKQHGYGQMYTTEEFLKPASWDPDRGDVHPAANST